MVNLKNIFFIMIVLNYETDLTILQSLTTCVRKLATKLETL